MGVMKKGTKVIDGSDRQALLREYFLNASLLANLKEAGREALKAADRRRSQSQLVSVQSVN